MSEGYWRGRGTRPSTGRVARPVPRAAALLAVAGAAAVAGCSSSGAGAAGTAGAAGAAGATSSAGMAAAGLPASFTAAQLRGALLTKVNGRQPAAVPEAGAFGKLPDAQLGKQSLRGVTVTPAKCAQATLTGFNSAEFANVPASVVTFRVGQDGVSEVIVAAPPATAAQALATKLPDGCTHYRATVAGRTFAYEVEEIPVSGLAQQARAVNVKAVGYPGVDMWSVVFRANGYVGAVTIFGPDASEQGAKVLAADAYAKAGDSLH